MMFKYFLLIAVLLFPQFAYPQVLIREEQIEDAYANLEGSDDAETTTNSTSTADCTDVTGLTISTNTPLLIIASLRKGTGASATASVGLKINSTEVVTDDTWSAGTNAVDTAIYRVWINSHDATYLRPAYIHSMSGLETELTQGFELADIPNAEITSITIRCRVTSASITMGVDSVKVYTFPGS